jgi:hypothetical protein
MINIAGSALLFGSFANANKNGELLLINRIESIQQPELLKEVLELLRVKRTLVAFSFPLLYLGCTLPLDYKAWSSECAVSPDVFTCAMALGMLLVLFGLLAPIFAAWMDRLLDSIPDKLLQAAPRTGSGRSEPSAACSPHDASD